LSVDAFQVKDRELAVTEVVLSEAGIEGDFVSAAAATAGRPSARAVASTTVVRKGILAGMPAILRFAALRHNWLGG
jgi:hypothetical protein